MGTIEAVARTVMLTGGGSGTLWDERALRDALARLGLAYATDATFGAVRLREDCEAFLDHESDEGVVALYEAADDAVEAGCARVVVRA